MFLKASFLMLLTLLPLKVHHPQSQLLGTHLRGTQGLFEAPTLGPQMGHPVLGEPTEAEVASDHQLLLILILLDSTLAGCGGHRSHPRAHVSPRDRALRGRRPGGWGALPLFPQCPEPGLAQGGAW